MTFAQSSRLARLIGGLLVSFLYFLGTGLVAETQLPNKRREISPAFKATDKKVRVAFFDADSTLRVAPSGSVSANAATDVAILPMVAPKLAELDKQGYLIAVVSNQLGVAKGYVSFETADGGLRTMMAQLASNGATIHYYDFAEAEDENRKPEPGMARRLETLVQTNFGVTIDWEKSFMVGDSAWKRGVDTEPDGTPGADFSNTDRLFAESVAKLHPGFAFHHPRDFFGWKKFSVVNFEKYDQLQKFLGAHSDMAPKGLNPGQ